MNKILYVGEDVDKVSNGGDVINKRNIYLLHKIFRDNFYKYKLTYSSKLTTFVNLIMNNVGFIQSQDYDLIRDLVRLNNINMVFLSSSKLGKLAEYLRSNFPEIKIVVFFHNIEKQYYSEELKVLYSLKTKIISKVVCSNEAKSIQNADMFITLNKRDSNLLFDIYNANSCLELPTSFIDDCDINKLSKYKALNYSRLNLLFVGSSFFANVYGIQWFIDNVLYNLPFAHLTIVGKDMDNKFVNSKQLTVCGYVEDISDFYYSSDVVIQPIFHGGGMKTKTAEAMMYGCPIIGTSESFEGYDLDYDKIGALANTSEDMIICLRRFYYDIELLNSCRHYSRNQFLKYYNTDSSIIKLKDILL